MHSTALAKINLHSEQIQVFGSLDYCSPRGIGRTFTCKDGYFPRVSVRLPQRLGHPIKPTFEQTQANSCEQTVCDPLDEIVAIGRARIPELKLGHRTIRDVLDSKPTAIRIEQTPKKRTLNDLNTATPTASALKRRRADADQSFDISADISADISVDGFTDRILRFVDTSLVDTPVKNTEIPKVQANAPGPSPRNAGGDYLYTQTGQEKEAKAVNPFRVGNMPPPNWRQFL